MAYEEKNIKKGFEGRNTYPNSLVHSHKTRQ